MEISSLINLSKWGLQEISLCFTLLSLITVLILCYLDYRKKRPLKEHPFLSFLIPCYNDGNTIEGTIKSIYDSYDKNKLEIIVVNDKSKDKSLEILKKLQKIYHFRLVNNIQNLGKSRSLNTIYKMAKSNLLFFVDADITLNKKSVEDLVRRMQYNSKLAAVSCPYITKDKGFIPAMQNLDYNMFSFLQASYNTTSTISLWGGCLLVKKECFESVGCFSENMLCEDLDLAFKLNEKKWKVEQSFYPVLTYVPTSLKIWLKQKTRWSAGGIQALFKHFKVWIKHPIQIFFLGIFTILTISSVIFFVKELLYLNVIWDSYELFRRTTSSLIALEGVGLYYGTIVLKNMLSRLVFTFLAIPYVVPLIKKPKDSLKLFYVIPFSFVYYPIFTIISIVGFVKGVYVHFRYDEEKRGW